MKLHYHKCVGGNFGDDLNQWLWDEILPGWREAWPDDILVGVGTIINDGLPPAGRKVIIGSGVGYGTLPDRVARSEWSIRAVRGPLTAQTLGLPPEVGIVDPAMLIADLPEFSAIEAGEETIFVPHHTSIRRHDWARLCQAAGVKYVSSQGESHDVIRQIAGARLVIAESMHAAILADAFRRPWIGVSITSSFNSFKWRDWGLSIGIEPMVRRFFVTDHAVEMLRRWKGGGRVLPKPRTQAVQSGQAKGSAGSVLRRARTRLEEAIAIRQFKRLQREPGQLSPDSKLQDQKRKLRALLAHIRGEFDRA